MINASMTTFQAVPSASLIARLSSLSIRSVIAHRSQSEALRACHVTRKLSWSAISRRPTNTD